MLTGFVLQGGTFLNGHFGEIMRSYNGAPMRRWAAEVPNDGLIYYRTIFNQERVMVTSPKALSEVLVQKSYEFVKPYQVRHGLGRVLGVGVLLAEGEEHKVRQVLSRSANEGQGRS